MQSSAAGDLHVVHRQETLAAGYLNKGVAATESMIFWNAFKRQSFNQIEYLCRIGIQSINNVVALKYSTGSQLATASCFTTLSGVCSPGQKLSSTRVGTHECAPPHTHTRSAFVSLSQAVVDRGWGKAVQVLQELGWGRAGCDATSSPPAPTPKV